MKQINQTETTTRTILCIPGNWSNRTEIVTAIAQNNAMNFIFAGMSLVNLRTNQVFELEICERDHRMKESYRWAGMVNKVSEDFLAEIDSHKYVLYLSAKTGDLASAKAIAETGYALLKSGGIGIKVESTGKAFTKNHWIDLLKNSSASSLYQMFVLDSISDGKEKTYSCGMHNLGFKDCIVYNEDFQQATDIISVFNHYQLIDNPTIKPNQTFGIDIESPVFVISEEKNQPYQGDELFENLYGMWRLERMISK